MGREHRAVRAALAASRPRNGGPDAGARPGSGQGLVRGRLLGSAQPRPDVRYRIPDTETDAG
ncbi:hypothetical protein, partial [Actinoalloteichus caeruleus]|uniref:hypothetical protein n=1 Tax=Actinoalloteichus cyanogriseus TaxID=2893586 RepID=UPI000AF2118A